MRTLISSTLIQLVFTVVAFTLVFVMTSHASGYQIRYFVFAMAGCILPLALFNIIGSGVIILSLRYIKAKNFKRQIHLTSIIFSIVIAMIVTMTSSSKTFFGEHTPPQQHFGIQTIYWVVVALILSFNFIRVNSMDVEQP